MYKIYKCDKDTYITNKIIQGEIKEYANTGIAGTLDLFKIYGNNFSLGSPLAELSRALIHFDISDLKTLYGENKIDPMHSSFFAKIKLKDVYGGQPTPQKFSLRVNSLSASFFEGNGKDIFKFQDYDSSNFIVASYDSVGNFINWNSYGCTSSGSIGDICDYFTGSLESSQFFDDGTENLEIDVTEQIKQTLLQNIPDEGFRVSFSQNEENNNRTYFAKRFASRQSYDVTKRPTLHIGFDDSIQDRSKGITFDNDSKFVLYNYRNGNLENLKDGQNIISGSNCLHLNLFLSQSAGTENFIFSGSQLSIGSVSYEGVYVANVNFPSDNILVTEIIGSGSSVQVVPIWESISGTRKFKVLEKLKIEDNLSINSSLATQNLTVSIADLKDTFFDNEKVVSKISVFDYESPLIFASRVSLEAPHGFQGIVSDAFFAIRDILTNEYIIPFDKEKGSTRVSSDLNGLFYSFDTKSLIANKSYVVDVLLSFGGKEKVYMNASPMFKVIKSPT